MNEILFYIRVVRHCIRNFHREEKRSSNLKEKKTFVFHSRRKVRHPVHLSSMNILKKKKTFVYLIGYLIRAVEEKSLKETDLLAVSQTENPIEGSSTSNSPIFPSSSLVRS